jgi:hypothetical protein
MIHLDAANGHNCVYAARSSDLAGWPAQRRRSRDDADMGAFGSELRPPDRVISELFPRQ